MIIYRNYMDIMRKRFPKVFLYGIVLFMLIFLFEYDSKVKIQSEEDQELIPIAVITSPKEDITDQYFLSYLCKYFKIVPIDRLRMERTDALLGMKVKCIVMLPEGFFEQERTRIMGKENRKRLEIQSVEDSLVVNYVNQVIDQYIDYLKIYSDQYKQESVEMIQKRIEELTKKTVLIKQMDQESAREKNGLASHSYHYLGFILFACLTTIICLSMNNYRDLGIFKKHLVAPISPTAIHLELLLGNLAYGYIYTVILVTLKMIFSNMEYISFKTLLYWENAFMYSTCIILFAYLLSFRIRQRVMVHIVANVIGVVVSIMSGVFIGQEYLTVPMKRVASLTPMYWYVYGNDLIQNNNIFDLERLLPLFKVFGIQMLFIGAFFSLILVSLKNMKTNN